MEGCLNGQSIAPDVARELCGVDVRIESVANDGKDAADASRGTAGSDSKDACPKRIEMVRVANQGRAISLPWHGLRLEPNQAMTVRLPLQIVHGDARLEVRNSFGITQAGRSLQTIARSRGADGRPVVDVELLGQSPGPQTLARWFEALGCLGRTDSHLHALLQTTARAVCDPGGMDAALLILRDADDWQIEASCLSDPEFGIAFSRDVIQQVASHGMTHFHDASEDLVTSSSSGADSVIAAPVFGVDDSVTAIVYGIRSLRSQNKRRGVRPLEALWIQLLAESLSGRLLRMQAEADAARNRVILEQAFNGKVVEQLIRDPSILESHDREVTTLFADLRGYSQISEQLGPEPTCQLLSEILEHLTQCTQSQDGVIIDYYGDGLAAMWNAPTDQPDHPVLACRAAIKMHAGLEEISQRWQSRIRSPLRLGIGINTGIAQVGNSGTKTRMKYGPRGQIVVVASRLESATRRTKAKTLISEATRKRLPSSAVLRRVCRGALPGIREPMDLYELFSMGDDQLQQSVMQRILVYETALALSESGNFNEADKLLSQYAGDDQDAFVSVEFLATHVSDQGGCQEACPVVDLTSIKH